MKLRILPAIRVFVSSTFSDMKEERDVSVKDCPYRR